MNKQSRAYYFVAMWLAACSVTGMLFQTVDVYLFASARYSLDWLKTTLYLMGLPSLFIFAHPKMKLIVKNLLGTVGAFAVAIAARYFTRFVLGIPEILLPSIESLLVIGFILSFAANFFFMIFYSRYKFYFNFLGNEERFTDAEKYASWLKEENVERSEKQLKRTGNILTNIVIFALLLSFFSIAKNPASKLFFSVYFTVYCLSALWMYLVVKQYDTLLDWKAKAMIVPEKLVANWNKLLRIMTIPLIIIPLAIPWYFRVFDISALTKVINDRMSGISLDIGAGIENAVAPDDLGNNVRVETNQSTVVTTDETERFGNQQITREVHIPYLKYVLIGIGGALVLFFILGIIGAIVSRKQRYNKRSPLAEFLIKIYHLMKGLIDGLATFFMIIGRFFAAMFGFHKFRGKVNDKDLAKPVASQLFSLFEGNQNMTDEKKEEIRTIIRDFVKMIEVTGRFVTPYRFYYGPLEYIELLIARLPELKSMLKQIVNIFNESRYSLHILSDVKIGNFQAATKYVIEQAGTFTEPGQKGT